VDDDAMAGIGDGTIEIPAYPFVESAALADAFELGAQIAESSAQFLRGYSLRLMAGHNYQVEQEDALASAAAAMERIVKGDSDGG
jgi:hypothetical protein